MPSLQLLLLFLAADLALKLTPGPDMALTLTRGMTQGFRVAWLSVLGTFSAGFVQLPLVVFGLAGIFRQSPLLFAAVKTAGACYLAYLGVRALLRLWQSRRGGNGMPAAAQAGSRAVFWQGFWTNLLNPKVFIFMIAFLPQFADPAAGPIWAQMLVLGVFSKLFGLLTGASFAYGASRIRHWLLRNPWFLKVQEGVLGVAMLAIAGYLFFNRNPVEGR